LRVARQSIKEKKVQAMISSTFFIFAAKYALYFSAFAHLLEKDARSTLKTKLLNKLIVIRRQSFERLAVDSVRLAHRVLKFIGGTEPFSASYFFRLFCIGGVLGLLFACGTLFFVSVDAAQVFRIVQKKYWQELVLMPSVMVGATLLPLDFAIAHLILLWASQGGTKRAGTAILLGGPVAYLTWTIGAAIASSFGLLIMSGYASPSFFLNRVVVAISNPLTSSAQMQVGSRWFSYSLLSAASGLTSTFVTGVFLAFGLLRAIPMKGQRIIVAPIFAALDIIRLLDQKKIYLPVKTLAWSVTGILLLFSFVFRMMGL